MHSKALGDWSSSAAGGGAAACVTAPGEDRIEVVGDSMPWSTGPSGGAVAKADEGLSGAPGSSVSAWAEIAQERVNGISSEREEYLSEVAWSLVGLGELVGPLSWVVLARGVGIAGRIFPVFDSCGTLNHSSLTN